MSLVSVALGARVVDSPAPRDDADRTTLAQVRPGGTATVLGLGGGTEPATARRLFDLGFAPGAEVQVLRRAPLADPVVFRVAGYEIALRRAQADLVDVSLLG